MEIGDRGYEIALGRLISMLFLMKLHWIMVGCGGS